MKAKRVKSHTECGTTLDVVGYCQECDEDPDICETGIHLFCPNCNIKLDRFQRCPDCGRIYTQ
jgi:hypothetical protein